MPGYYTSVNDLEVEWEIVDYGEDYIEIKIYYKDPVKVAQNYEPDTLIIWVNMTSFTDQNGNQIEYSDTFEVPVPT